MKTSEIKILNCLRQDGRQSLKEISKKTGIPISTVYDKIREAEWLKKVVPILDFGSLGFQTRACIFIKTSDKEKIIKHLEKNTNINTLFKINNGWDIMADAVFKTMKEAEKFTEELEQKYELEKKEIHYIIEEIKQEEFLLTQPLAVIGH